MRRKPRILRFLYVAAVTLILLWGSYQEFFVPHQKSSLRLNYLASPYAYGWGNDEAQQYDGITVNALGDPWVIPSKKDEISEEQLNILKLQIEQLKNEKNVLGENIARLKEENDKLEKINFDMEKTIIEFVERNKIRDILIGALIGAVISIALSFMLSMPQIRGKIIDYFFKNESE